jgi:hypothetical protein
MCFDSAWDLEVYASVGPQDLQVFQHRIVPLRPRVSVQPIGVEYTQGSDKFVGCASSNRPL